MRISYGFCQIAWMFKDFEKWNLEKQFIDKKNRTLYYKNREVWWCSIGINVGDEENGKGIQFTRPVLVFRKLGQNLFLGIPLTSYIKPNSIFYLQIEVNNIKSSLLISQVRCFDTRRLTRKIGKLSLIDFQKVKQAIQTLIG